MGSKTVQERLWGKMPNEWASIQEPTFTACYAYALNFLQLTPADNVLDIGCGTGLFSSLAHAKGARITGIDATANFIELAKQHYPAVTFLTGEMEELPFANSAFDVVCGFNSFQYAASVKNALTEAGRVLKPGGRLVAMVWGNREDCEAATYVKALGSQLPPPPPGAAGPFALSENQLLEKLLHETGFTIIENTDVPAVWDYENTGIAIKALLSAGPAAMAIEHSGYERVYEVISAAVQPYVQSNGRVVYHNKFRVVVAGK